MINIKILAVGLICILPVYATSVAIGASCTKVTCPSDIRMLPVLPTYYQCASTGTKECYTNGTQTYSFTPCTSCEPGFTLTTAAFTQCGESNKIFKVCDCVCTNCVSDVDWSNVGTGYQKHVSRYCECSSGTPTYIADTSYRCAAGYYGRSSNGTSGCTQCPQWSGVYTNSARTTLVRGTSAAGATAITGCYIPAGTYYDVSGTFTTSANCSYI